MLNFYYEFILLTTVKKIIVRFKNLQGLLFGIGWSIEVLKALTREGKI